MKPFVCRYTSCVVAAIQDVFYFRRPIETTALSALNPTNTTV